MRGRRRLVSDGHSWYVVGRVLRRSARSRRWRRAVAADTTTDKDRSVALCREVVLPRVKARTTPESVVIRLFLLLPDNFSAFPPTL